MGVGIAIMLGSLGWGFSKLLSWRKTNPKPGISLTYAVGVIGSFLVGQLFFDAGIMFYLGYLTALLSWVTYRHIEVSREKHEKSIYNA